jgi:pSer/pThr/pTyr-binding forkhead associated (FHA) protein
MENKINKIKQTESIKKTDSGYKEEISKDILSNLQKIPEGKAGIVVIKGPNVGEKFFLIKPKFEIGRSHDSDILLDDVTVSRKHAVLDKVGNDYIISDLNSLNGTYVNGEIVNNSKLKNGDKIQIGKYIFLFFHSK